MVRLRFWRKEKRLIPEIYYDDPLIQDWIKNQAIIRLRGKPYTVQDFYDWELEKKFNEWMKNGSVQSVI